MLKIALITSLAILLVANNLQAQTFSGTWSGSFRILGILSPITLELNAQGTNLEGVLKDNQNTYRIAGTVTGNRSEGKILTSVGIRYNYSMEITDDRLHFSYKAGVLGTYRSELTRAGGGSSPYPVPQRPTPTDNAEPAISASPSPAPQPPKVPEGPRSTQGVKNPPSTALSSISKGKLYLRSVFWSSSSTLEISMLYLGSDGIVIINPSKGADPVNPAAEAVAHPAQVGKYQITGQQALISWQNGPQQTISIERNEKGELSAWDGGLTSLCNKFPANTRLNQCYTGTASVGSGRISNTSTFQFHSDGSFEQGLHGSISVSEAGKSSTAQYKGDYTLGGNTLHLSYEDGRKEIMVIAPYTDYNQQEGFIMNGRQFKPCR